MYILNTYAAFEKYVFSEYFFQFLALSTYKRTSLSVTASASFECPIFYCR